MNSTKLEVICVTRITSGQVLGAGCLTSALPVNILCIWVATVRVGFLAVQLVVVLHGILKTLMWQLVLFWYGFCISRVIRHDITKPAFYLVTGPIICNATRHSSDFPKTACMTAGVGPSTVSPKQKHTCWASENLLPTPTHPTLHPKPYISIMLCLILQINFSWSTKTLHTLNKIKSVTTHSRHGPLKVFISAL